MNTFDRMELIAEIEALTAESGMDLTVSGRLEDLPDFQLVQLRDGLQEEIERMSVLVGG